MWRLALVVALAAAPFARAAEAEVGAEAPAAASEPQPVAPPVPEPVAKPLKVATEAERAALERDLKPLSGLARAERLLAFAAEFPDDPRALSAEASAKELVAEARAHESDEPVLDAVNAALKASGPARRARLDELANLKDPRAVPFLAYLARRDGEQETRIAAARLFGKFGPGPAEDAAAEILLDDRENPAVRAAAAEGLGGTGGAVARKRLEEVAADEQHPDEVRQAALASLRAHFPGAEPAGGLRIANSSGRTLGTITGALSGSYALGLVGDLSPNSSVGVTAGALGGLVIGGAATYLLSKGYDLSQGDALYLLSAAGWSVPVGYLAGGLAGGPSAECTGNACSGIMLATHVASMGAAWATRKALHLSVPDVIELNLAALSTTAMVDGLLAQPRPGSDLRLGRAVASVGPLLGFVSGALLADRLRISFPLAALALVGGAEGALAGGFFGEAFVPRSYTDGPLGTEQPNDRRSAQIEGLSWLGFGVGVGGVLAASAFTQPNGSDALLVGSGILDGNMLGAGLPLLFGAAEKGTYIGVGLGGLVGAAATVGLLRPLDLRLEHGDALLVLGGRGFAAFQAFGWAQVLHDAQVLKSDPSAGFALTTLGLAGAGLTALAQKLDLSAWHVAWLYSGAVWGGWLAGWGAYAVDARDTGILTCALVGSDLGLGAAALLLSPTVGLDPTTLAWMSVGGVAGMTVGTLFATFFGYRSSGHPVAIANVVGSTVGLTVGAVLATKLGPGEAGAGGELGPSFDFLGDLPLPTPSVGPATDAEGHVVRGASASLVWAM